MFFFVTWMMGMLATANSARAESPPGYGGMCSGGGLSGTTGLAIKNASGSVETVQGSQLASLFGDAECACGTEDINLQVKLSSGLPVGTAGSVEVWVGVGCDSYAVRSSPGQATCEQVATLDIQQLTSLSTAGADGILVPIPSRTLFAPVTHACPSGVAVASQVYLIAFDNPAENIASCSLDLFGQTHGPESAQAPSATRAADGTVTVRWTGPDATSSYFPTGYQLLCADLDGRPLAGSAREPTYSLCQDGIMARRSLPGVTYSQPPLPAKAMLASLHPAYACSPPLGATATQATLEGIAPERPFQLTVVAFDKYGNASASSVVAVDVAPAAPPAHGCSFTDAPATPPVGLALLTLALSLLLRRTRRRA
jgi:MYXO-CTERM domain-containing protein